MKTLRKLIYMFAALLTALLSVGCSQTGGGDPDDPGQAEGSPTEVTFTVSSRAANNTRADGRPENPSQKVELIHSWWLALKDGKGNVRIVSRESESENGFESESMKCIVPSGTYDIYAFANVPEKSAEEIKGILDEGKGLESILGAGFTQSGMEWPSDQNIPMTGFRNKVIIRNAIEESFAIEVIRAVAKIEFSINNSSDDEITLKNLNFEQVTKSDVSLFPDYSAIGNYAFTALADAQYGSLSLDKYLDANALTQGVPHAFSFYCKESLGKKYEGEENEAFKISLTVDRKRAGAETAETVQREFFTSKISNYINRNDWIKFPIEFNDWKVYWKLDFFPPIGGYAPVYDQNEDGSTLTATLHSGGEFELYPSKIAKGSEDYKEQIDWTTVDVEVVSGEELFLTRPEKITYSNSKTVIVGELNYRTTGTAQVKITFRLKDNAISSTLFTSVFTINRVNP